MDKGQTFSAFEKREFEKVENLRIWAPRPVKFKFNISVNNKNIIVLQIHTNIQPGILIRNVFIKLSTSCRNLRRIYLGQNKLKDQAIRFIKDAELEFIESAEFRDNFITHVGVKVIVQCGWKRLTFLDLGKNSIKNKGLHYLSRTNWEHLTMICLEKTSITNDGMNFLAKAPWIKLNYLIIYGNNLTNSFLKCLLTSNFHQLKLISDGYSQILFLDHTVAKIPSAWNKMEFRSYILHAPSGFLKIINNKMEDPLSNKPRA